MLQSLETAKTMDFRSNGESARFLARKALCKAVGLAEADINVNIPLRHDLLALVIYDFETLRRHFDLDDRALTCTECHSGKCNKSGISYSFDFSEQESVWYI